MEYALTPIRVTLRAAREAAGLTQVQLAEQADVRQGTVSDIETGKSGRLDLEVLDRLCRVLGIEPGDIIKRDAPQRRSKKRG